MLKVGVVMPASIGDPGEFVANVRALDAAGAYMVEIQGDGESQLIMLGALAALTERIKVRTHAKKHAELVHRLSRGRALTELPAGERWVVIAMPPDRASWMEAIREHEAAGAHGVIVAWDERLIDLLRNPEPDDRSDLLMSTG